MFAFFKRFQDGLSSHALNLDQFDALLHAQGSRWYAACLRITKDAMLAEDALQEALIRAWDQHDKFRAEAELSTWVHRIAVNCAIDLLRRQRGDLSLDQLHEQGHELAQSASQHNDSTVSPTIGFTQQLQHALSELSNLERLCFLLKHKEDYRLDEVASRLGVSIDSVKQALFRAMKKLRLQLAPWQD